MSVTTACGSSPTSPRCASTINTLDGFSLRCEPQTDALRCRAIAVLNCDEVDVTPRVQSWMSSDANVVAISGAASEPGVARSVALGDAQITAQADGVTSFAARVRVLPGWPPLIVADIYSFVRLAPACGVNDGVSGVQVTATDGVLAGLSATTDANGRFGWPNIVSPPSVTLRATKAGYQDATVTGGYTGIPVICIAPAR